MISFNLELDSKTTSQIKELIGSLEASPQDVFPSVVGEFDSFVEGMSETLQNYVKGEGKLVNTEPIPDKYKKSVGSILQSITVRKPNPLEAVVKADSPILDRIQEGQKESEYDMKKTYPFGAKSRVSRDKNGKIKSNYLIICFRWGSKGETAHFNSYIPEKIYRTQTSNMEMSWKLDSTHKEENSRGEMIERNDYIWKDRIDGANAYAYTKSRVWKGERLTTTITNEGMVRMKHDTNDSEFVTFRVISTKSPKDSWIRRYDEIKPVDIQKGWENTMELIKPEFEKNLEESLKNDLENLMG